MCVCVRYNTRVFSFSFIFSLGVFPFASPSTAPARQRVSGGIHYKSLAVWPISRHRRSPTVKSAHPSTAAGAQLVSRSVWPLSVVIATLRPRQPAYRGRVEGESCRSFHDVSTPVRAPFVRSFPRGRAARSISPPHGPTGRVRRGRGSIGAVPPPAKAFFLFFPSTFSRPLTERTS